MLQETCRKFRLDNELTIDKMLQITKSNVKPGTLSAFEHGRSSNLVHFELYLLLSYKLGLTIDFFNRVNKALMDEQNRND